jgi:hypothetical protein
VLRIPWDSNPQVVFATASFPAMLLSIRIVSKLPACYLITLPCSARRAGIEPVFGISRNTQDSNLQAFYSQRFSRPRPLHPDMFLKKKLTFLMGIAPRQPVMSYTTTLRKILDSNQWYRLRYAGLANRCIRPLCQSSKIVGRFKTCPGRQTIFKFNLHNISHHAVPLG